MNSRHRTRDVGLRRRLVPHAGRVHWGRGPAAGSGPGAAHGSADPPCAASPRRRTSCRCCGEFIRSGRKAAQIAQFHPALTTSTCRSGSAWSTRAPTTARGPCPERLKPPQQPRKASQTARGFTSTGVGCRASAHARVRWRAARIVACRRVRQPGAQHSWKCREGQAFPAAASRRPHPPAPSPANCAGEGENFTFPDAPFPAEAGVYTLSHAVCGRGWRGTSRVRVPW
jgi:hypothetical protein